VDEADDVVIEGPYVAILDTEGSFSLELPTQENLYYNIKVALDSIGYEQFPLAPGAADAVLDMSDVQPIEDVPFTPLLVTQATEAREEAQAAATAAAQDALAAQNSRDAAAVSEFNADASADLAQTAATTATAASDNATTKAANIPAWPVIATNTVRNPGFEVNDTGWVSTQGVITRSTAWSSKGTASGKFTVAGPTTSSCGPWFPGETSSSNPITPNGWVRATCTIRGIRACQTTFLFTWYNSVGSSLGNTNFESYQVLPDQTIKMDARGEAPVNATAVSVRVLTQSDTGGNITDGDAFYLDEACVVSGKDLTAVLCEPFDGDSVGCRWTGTPHYSLSQRVAVTDDPRAVSEYTRAPVVAPNLTVVEPNVGLNTGSRTGIASSGTGAVVISFKVPTDASLMVQAEVELWGYSPISRTTLTAITYSQSSGSFSPGSANYTTLGGLGSAQPMTFPSKVRWVRSTDKATLYLIIGDVADVHGYPQVYVKRLTAHYGGQSLAMSQPTVSLATSLPAGVTYTVPTVWRDGVLYGNGSPEASVPAPIGTRYIDMASTNGAVEWIKYSGTFAATTAWKVVYGDTGYRDVSSVVSWVNTRVAVDDAFVESAFVHRNGDHVTFNAYYRTVNPDPGPGNILTGIPTGFRPARSLMAPVNNNSSYLVGIGSVSISAAGVVYGRGTAGVVGFISATYLTSDPWPVLMPGVAA
jgi:hypothetical protein